MDYLCADMGWGPDLNPEPNGDTTQTFQVRLHALGYYPERLQIECCTNARKIMEAARAINKRPLIFLSGGMDSMSVLWSFLLAGIPHEDFDVMIYHTHMNGKPLNAPDVSRALKLVQKFPRITVRTEPVVLNAEGKGHDQHSKPYHIRADLGLYLRHHVASVYGHSHFPVMGSDICAFGFIPETDNIGLCAIFKPFNPTTQMLPSDVAGVPCFHAYRPDSLQALFNAIDDASEERHLDLIRPHFERLERKAYGNVAWTGARIYETLVKPIVYEKAWPQMDCFPKETGFENGPDLSVDPISNEVVQLRYERSVVVPLYKLSGGRFSADRTFVSSDKPCELLKNFKKEQHEPRLQV